MLGRSKIILLPHYRFKCDVARFNSICSTDIKHIKVSEVKSYFLKTLYFKNKGVNISAFNFFRMNLFIVVIIQWLSQDEKPTILCHLCVLYAFFQALLSACRLRKIHAGKSPRSVKSSQRHNHAGK